jgi:hypothetical protein
VLNYVEDNKPILEDHPILREYKYVFPNEVSSLPPRRDVDFSIELVPGAVPMSRAPYGMSTPELVELKLQLKEMLEKVTFNLVCLLGSTNSVCEEEGWHTQVVCRLYTIQ